MSKSLPIARAKEIADKHPELKQVIVVAWDGSNTHVVTWGNDVHQCDMAAQGGNFVKKALGWPNELCNAESQSVLKLKNRIKELGGVYTIQTSR